MDESIVNATRNIYAILDPFTPEARKIIVDELRKVLNIK